MFRYFIAITAGDYEVKSKTATVTVSQSGTEFTGGVKAYNGETETYTFSAGDIITVKATPKATGAAPANAAMMMASFAEPTVGQMAVYYGGQQVSAPSTVADGVHTMTVDTNDLPPEAFNKAIPLAVKYIGDGNQASAEASVTVTVKAEASVTAGGASTYYGTFEDAWNAALAAKTATITMLADVTTAAGSPELEIPDTGAGSGADITLVGNGKTFTSNIGNQFKVKTGKLTLQNCTFNSEENFILFVYVECQVELKGSTVNVPFRFPAVETFGPITMDKDSTIIGVTLFETYPQQLTAGTFSSEAETPISCDGGITLGNLLKNYRDNNASKHYAYYSGSTPILDVLELTEFPAAYRTVTIGECTNHVWGYTHVGDSLTHTKTCRACGYSVTEDCKYVFDGNVGTCQACGDALTVLVGTERMVYDGSAKVPEVTVKRGDTVLALHTDYNWACPNNVNAGDVTLSVLIGSFQGTYSYPFTIEKAAPTITWGTEAQTLTYTGNTEDVTEPTVTLVNGEQFSGAFTYSYGTYTGPDLPTNAGTYTVTASIAAEGNYTEATSTNTLTLTINKADQSAPAAPAAEDANIKDTSITLNTITNAEYSKDGTAWQESPEFTGLDPNRTYTFYARLKGDDNHNPSPDSAAASVTTKKAMLDTAAVSLSHTSYTYDGTAHTPDVTVIKNGRTLAKDTDYTVAYTGNTNAGTATVTVTGIGSYDGTNSATFTITPAPLTGDMVTLSSESVTYSGAEQALAVTVDGLALGTDYTVSYSNNKNVGTATVTVTGKGNCTGEVKKTFSITKATPSLTPPTATAIQYGQKLSDSTLNGGGAVNPNGNAAVAGKWSWASSSTQPTATGDFPAAFTPTDTANYETPESVDVNVTVNPATPEITLTVPSYQVANGKVTVVCEVKNPHDTTKNDLPAVTLTYTINGEEKAVDADGSFIVPSDAAIGSVITVTAKTAAADGKYSATTKTATVTVTDKIPVTISGVTAQNGTYNGSTHIGYTGTPTASPYSGSFTATYAGRNGTSYNSTTPPTNAGDYTVTISLADTDTYIGSLTLDFTIGKASITITADSLTADVGSAKPALTYTVTGLIRGETLATAPTLTCDADMNTVGSYPITASGAAVPSGGNYNTEITYVPGTLTVTDPTIHVTGVTLNKASTTLTVGGSERLTATVAPDNATDKSVTWISSNTAVATVDSSGNITAVSAGTATITVTTADGGKTAACTVTVNKPSSGPSGGGSYVPSNPTSTVTVPVSGDRNTVRVTASVSGSTATVSKIDTTQIDSVIGGSAQTSMVEIDFTGLGKTIDTVKLPADAIAEIAAAAQNKNVGGLTVKLSNSEISFNGDALAAIQAQAGSQITLTVTPAKTGDLNARQKETVGSAPVYDLTLQSNGRTITDFRGGYVTVSLPYTLTAGQNPSGVVVYYLDSTGNITPCTTIYDVRNQSAIFTTSHLSLYFVGYDPAAVWANPFTDVAEGAWYYNAVRFVNQNGLMNGYSNGSFGPNDYLSRAMLAQILYNRAGKPAVTGGSIFTDVAPGQWYTNAVIWANQNGIVSGYGNGLFGPNDNITREQLAVMLWRYAGSPAATDKELHFTDADQASGYAMEALRWAVENGVINGYGDGRLGPKGLATRAQVAQMLMNFLGK